MLRRRALAILACLLVGLGSTTLSLAQQVPVEPRDDCGFQDVDAISDGPGDLELACTALREIIAYFRTMGFGVVPAISMRFVDAPADRASPHGYFDPGKGQIVVYRTAHVSPWGLPWSRALVASFLKHELVHMVVWHVVRDRGRLPREWHEFIAYVVQLDLMEPTDLTEILKNHSSIQPFSELLSVNEFTYGMGPEAFAVAAYKMHYQRGGMAFLRQLLSGEIVPPTVGHPFPVFPDETPRR